MDLLYVYPLNLDNVENTLMRKGQFSSTQNTYFRHEEKEEPLMQDSSR